MANVGSEIIDNTSYAYDMESKNSLGLRHKILMWSGKLIYDKNKIEPVPLDDGGQPAGVKTPVITISDEGSVSITCATEGATIYYTTDGSTPDNTSTAYSGEFTVTNHTTVKAIAYAVIEEVEKASPVASKTYSVATLPVATPVISPASGQINYGSSVTITCATEGATIYYTDDGSTPSASSTEYTGPIELTEAKTIKAIAIKEGMDDSGVASASYTIRMDGVANPVISPAAGAVNKGTEVSISCATNGATIHYTIDGSTPSTSSPTYSSPFEINAATTVKAIAVKTGMTASGVVSVSYTIAKVATPSISPAAGAVNKGTSVTIACATNGATIHYTTDGTTPTASSPTYSGAITVNAAQTIKAIAVKSDMDDSAVASAAYTIKKVAAPTFSPSASQIEAGTEITISTSTSGATIYYTDDNSDPSTSNTRIQYSGPITFSASKTYKAIATKSDMDDSSVTTKAYTLKVTLYAYAGVFNNPDEDTDIEPTSSDITLEWLEALVNKDKFVATSKAYGGLGNEKPFSGISEDFGGRLVYSYPASFGDLTSFIQNGSTQAINNSFDKLTSTVNGVEYNTYVLRDMVASPAMTGAFV